MRRGETGFTLVELIISLSIGALLLLIIGGAMLLGYRSEEKASERTERAMIYRTTSEKLRWLLKGIYPFRRRSPSGSELYFNGTSEGVEFVTTSTITQDDSLLEQSGMKWVRLYLESDKLMVKENYFFLEDVEDREPANEYTLLKDVTELSIQYLDTSEEPEGEWVSSWSSEERDTLPSAIRINLKIKYREEEIELPPLVVKIMTSR